jgi:hypothetical protein
MHATQTRSLIVRIVNHKKKIEEKEVQKRKERQCIPY